MEERNYTVYQFIFPSNKVYIGITSQKPYKRWKCGKGYKNCRLVNRAINKYGWNNVVKNVLYTNLTQAEAKRMEIELIKIFKSDNVKYGYNASPGGDCGVKLTEAQKEHLRQINLGKHHSEETKRKMSESRKGNKYNLGKKLSEERKRQISESQMGAKNQHAKRVICLETLKIYDTLTQAKEETGATKITECCRHYPKHKSSNGLHWEFYDEELTFGDYKDILAWLLEGF